MTEKDRIEKQVFTNFRTPYHSLNRILAHLVCDGKHSLYDTYLSKVVISIKLALTIDL